LGESDLSERSATGGLEKKVGEKPRLSPGGKLLEMGEAKSIELLLGGNTAIGETRKSRNLRGGANREEKRNAKSVTETYNQMITLLRNAEGGHT